MSRLRTTRVARGIRGLILAALAGGLIQPALCRADELRDAIDAEIRKVWDREKVTPAPVADDAAFLRRVWLDLCGIIPTHDQAKEFLDDPDPAKRAKLIDRLFDDPRFAQHQADVWDMLLFGRHPPGYDADKRGGFQNWLRDAFANKLPYDKLVHALLKAEGNTAEQGAPMYLVQYERRPEDAAIAVSQQLLGVQLQCARCHDHPYESWTQRDFYGMAAFFARLGTVRAGKHEQLDKIFLVETNTGDVKFVGPAKDAVAGKEGEPVKPKFLLGEPLDEPDLSEEFKNEKRPSDGQAPPPPKFSRKDRLADWATSPANPFFAKAAVNRFWSQFFGRGLVHPVDNMSTNNPPSHPELLDRLAKDFVEHRFDIRWLIREFCNSQTYQLAATGDVTEPMPRGFERARVRPLSAEELLESWRVATGYDEVVKLSGKKTDGRFHGVTFDYIRRFFGEPNNGVGDFQGGLQEHLYLNNGELGRLLTSEKGGLIATITASTDPPESRVERLFLSVLSRRPTDPERTRFVEHLAAGDNNKEKTNELLRESIWVLMTCSEFRFNR